MFTVGEFAHLAQVSKRLLRYYDEIDLFKPDRIDRSSGYRFYTAEQMPQLNRILALKELGLSLSQIQRSLTHDVSTDEIQGMLMLRKAEIEQQLDVELRRIREIEARLQSIRDDESNTPPNVILKQIPEQTILSTRRIVEDFETGMAIYSSMQAALPASLSDSMFFCICRSDTGVTNKLDLEFGVLLNKASEESLVLGDELKLLRGKLPAQAMMATTVVTGALDTIHTGYAAIMRWAAIHAYRLDGMHRELCLQLPQKADGSDLITEIQVPVQPLPLTES
jgi:DNA-binding transcriptional MerR regulator